MKAVITKTKFVRDYIGPHGQMFVHAIYYNDKVGEYTSKSKEQTKFVEGQEAEFNEIKKTGKKGDFIKVVPSTSRFIKNANTDLGKNVIKEQSRYSGFSTSYAKDMAVAGLIKVDEIIPWSHKLFNHMVELDKSLLEND